VQTYQRWRSQFKTMRPEDVVRLKALERTLGNRRAMHRERKGRFVGQESGDRGSAGVHT